MAKFSIILPVFNGGHLVKECVNSILAQDLPEFDLLVLDNASNDGTSEWLTSLSDSRIRVTRSDTKLSMEGNWARIKDIPKNEFMTLIGHDDILHPHYLSEMSRLIEKHPHATLYQAHFDFIDAAGKHISYCKPMDEVQYGHEFLACHMMQTMDSMGTGYCFRSDDYNKLGGIPCDYPNLIFADYVLWIRLCLLGYKATTNRNCFSYRIHQSVSKLTNGEQYQQAFEKYVQVIAELCKQDEEVNRVVERYGHHMLMYYCESLSHRLLKTPLEKRRTKVDEYIARCKGYAAMLIPGQPFAPEEKFRIRVAGNIDSNPLTRGLFQFLRKMI